MVSTAYEIFFPFRTRGQQEQARWKENDIFQFDWFQRSIVYDSREER